METKLALELPDGRVRFRVYGDSPDNTGIVWQKYVDGADKEGQKQAQKEMDEIHKRIYGK